MNKLLNFIYQIGFAVAIIMLALAVIDWIMRLFGYTLSFIPYEPGRLFEFAGIILLFVITVLLRQIRDGAK